MARRGDRRRNAERPVIIRKEERGGDAHHGGAWKVAYADFVTAMMAFFLLMWLLNATSEDQKRGLADYFSPHSAIANAVSGSGAPFGGHTPFDKGDMVSDRGAVEPVNAPEATSGATHQDAAPDVTAISHPQPPKDSVPRASSAAGPNASPADAGHPADPAPALGPATTSRPDASSAGTAGDGPDQAPAPSLPDRGTGKGVQAARGQAGTAPDNAAGAAAGPGGGQGGSAPESAAQSGAPQSGAGQSGGSQSGGGQESAAREGAALAAAAAALRQQIRTDPELAELAQHVSVDVTPEGLRMQVMDSDAEPMFALGSAIPNARVRTVLRKLAPVLQRLPEPIAIDGHTDAARYQGTDRSNWELSADRANAARRMLMEFGVPEARIASVTGRADRGLLVPSDPYAAANRRISILLRRMVQPPAQAGGKVPAPAKTGPSGHDSGPVQR